MEHLARYMEHLARYMEHLARYMEHLARYMEHLARYPFPIEMHESLLRNVNQPKTPYCSLFPVPSSQPLTLVLSNYLIIHCSRGK